MTPTDIKPGAALASVMTADTIPEDKHYRLTGELPTPSEETADSQAEVEAEPTSDDPASSNEGETSAAPPAAPQQRESKSDKRWKELSERVGARERENEALRRRLEELENRRTEPSDKAVSQPAATEPVKLVKPKLGDNDPKTGKPFASIEAWQDALEEYNDKRLEERLADRFSKAEQTRTQTEQERAQAQAIFEKLKPMTAKYPDFEKIALNAALPIPKGSPANQFIDESENPGELLYYLGQHPEILAEFYGCTLDPVTQRWNYGDFDGKTGKFTNHVTPIQQIRRLEAIERELSGSSEPAAPVRAASPTPAKRVTNAPRPPHEVSARASTTTSPIEEALTNDDQEKYAELANARDLARRKGR